MTNVPKEQMDLRFSNSAFVGDEGGMASSPSPTPLEGAAVLQFRKSAPKQRPIEAPDRAAVLERILNRVKMF